MPRALPLTPAQLRRPCDPGEFAFATTAELEDLTELFGQERAKRAVEFGIAVPHEGYNLFVLGPTGSGKWTLLRRLVEQRAATLVRPPDWCYVFDFEHSHVPRALKLPAGMGARLRDDMRHLVEDLLAAIPAVFEGDEYRAKLEQVDAEFNERNEKALAELGEVAAKENIGLVRTPAGITLAPLRNGEVLGPEEFAALEQARRDEYAKNIADLQERLEALLRNVHRWHRERRERVRALNREVASYSVNLAVDEIRRSYAELPDVLAYVDAVRHDLIENADVFRRGSESSAGGQQPGESSDGTVSPLTRYRVNLLVEQTPASGAPVIDEEHPTHQNLMGRIEHVAQLGTLLTDFMLIKAGALHRANGGFLLLDAYKLLTQPFAWDALKRALQTRRLRMESLGQLYGLVSTLSLEPEPIPLDVKVILFGERQWYHMLYALDPEFGQLFKVAVDFDDDVARTPHNQQLLARLIGTLGRGRDLLPLDPAGVARVIEQSAREVEDSERLSTHVEGLLDLLVEADFHARSTGAPVVTSTHVDAAVAAQIARSDRIDERLREEILRDTIMIDTAGERVGQVNALAAYWVGGHLFGKPTRITATTRVGEGEVMDVQREIQRGGPIHSKGVLILASFLAARFSALRPHSLRASLVFEQCYDEVEGDSASGAELCALLSSLSGYPLRQSIGITGSVNQHGELQPIGAVNAKIEGFFAICKARGLTGEQGVVVPASNVKHLMLRDDVIEAVAAGTFRVYAAGTIDEAIELLTGVDAGTPLAMGDYPPDSVNGRVAQRLREFARAREPIVAARGLLQRRAPIKRLRD